jgi:tripartite-type tricarboxylate transporter receptor subunit TctC
MPGRRLVLLPVLALTLSACGDAGDAEETELADQIEIIVPYAAGGGTDQTARQLATAAEEACGIGTVVTNQEGAAGAVGFQAVASAEPDGTTIGLATAELAMLEHLGTAEVTPQDVTGVLQYNFDPAAFTVDADSQYETIEDVVDAAEDGETITVGTSGAGSIWEISAAGMASETGNEFTYAPFDGAAPAITAVLSGEVDATSASGAEVLGQVESDELRALAVMGEERLDILPDTPTLTEAGIDWVSGTWRGLSVPAATSPEMVDALEECFTEAAESEEFTSFMEETGFGVEYRGAAEFEAYMDEEYETFGEIIPQVGGE